MVKVFLRSVKKQVLRCLRALPISSKHLGPPKRTVQTTKDWVRTTKKKCDTSYQEVTARNIVRRKTPITVDPEVHSAFQRVATQTHEPCFVVRLKNGRVLGQNGTIITSDDSLLRDVSRESADMTAPHTATMALKLHTCTRREKTVAVLGTVWSYVYFHWMLDIIPRIKILKMANIDLENIDCFVIPNNNLRFQVEVLKKIGISERKIIHAENDQSLHMEAANLIVPSLPSSLDSPPAWACAYVKTIYQDCLATTALPQRRIYISRAKAAGRKILNEDDVLATLLPFGFKRIELETMAVQDQAKIFSETEIVIAAHGAGLTNILFCRPGTVILDIFSPRYVNPCYWILANEMQLTYGYLIGEDLGSREKINVDPKQENIFINLDELKKILRHLNIE